MMGKGAAESMMSGIGGLIPGMMFGGSKGGGQPSAPPFSPPHGVNGAQPATPPAATPGMSFKQFPGYSQPMPLFGNMSPEQLAAFNKATGTFTPPRPPARA